MTIQESMSVFDKILKKNNIISIVGIVPENPKPHLFNVDGEHTAYAKDTNKGILEEYILEMFPCGAKGCTLSYAEHTTENKLMLVLNKDMTQAEAQEEVLKLAPSFEKHSVVTLAFVEGDGDKKFKFL